MFLTNEMLSQGYIYFGSSMMYLCELQGLPHIVQLWPIMLMQPCREDSEETLSSLFADSGARPGTVWGDACSMVSSTSNGRKIRPEIYGARNYSMDNYFKNFNSCMYETH